MMFQMIIVLAVLATLFGLAWHNEPSREAGRDRRSNRSQKPNESIPARQNPH